MPGVGKGCWRIRLCISILSPLKPDEISAVPFQFDDGLETESSELVESIVNTIRQSSYAHIIDIPIQRF
jgi:hypothetical protein